MMLPGRAFHGEGATNLQALWPYRFVLASLGPGIPKIEKLRSKTARGGVGLHLGVRQVEWCVFFDRAEGN